MTVSATFTLSRMLDADRRVGGKKMSTREPNLIMPTRSPRTTSSPSFLSKTMRRARRPAICLKASVPPRASSHDDQVLLVLRRRLLDHGRQFLPRVVAVVDDLAGDRRAVHVHVEDGHEDRDLPREAGPDRAVGDVLDLDDRAVGGGEDVDVTLASRRDADRGRS